MDLFQKCNDYKDPEQVKAMGLYPYFVPITESYDTEFYVNGEKKIMIGSNNYLGLTHHPKILEALEKASKKYGSGCTGSRFLNGTIDLHEQLENELAKFVNKESALVFSTGFQTNLGTIATLVGKNDAVIIDKLVHASIIDACRMSFGEVYKFNHNNSEDLERVLQKIDKNRGKLVVVDGIFSMEGDIAKLDKLIPVLKKYGCKIMVDDAHAMGVLGKNGAGTPEHFNLTDEVDLIMGTFSKSFASIGGFIAGPESVIQYLKHHSRTLIFSASMPPSAVATVLAALEIIKTEPERRENLWNIARKMKKEFISLGFDTGSSETPVIPIIIGDDLQTFSFWKRLFDEGVYTNPVIYPAVPRKTSRLRTSYIATHTENQLDFILEKFKKVGKEFGVI
ncbi:8-amino-7-oxononanoate synthase [candidate division KSB1 bacterium]|nr:MAG: 8-amino-7-oxononanoate synthase [candidate division KSB1 bacterium]